MDIKRIGTLQLGDQAWRYSRHGAGVMFERPGATVDAHEGLAVCPRGVDGCRLLQFLESRGVTEFAFEGEIVVIDFDEKGLERILDRMARAGILEVVHIDRLARLFVPVRRAPDLN